MTEKKPWPRDALMIVAGCHTPGRRVERGRVIVKCRACQVRLEVNQATINMAHDLPDRAGRPLDYFCMPCALEHGQGGPIDKLRSRPPRLDPSRN